MILEKDETMSEIIQSTLATALIQGIISIVAGLFCHSGFVYLATVIGLTPPTLWVSVSLVFVIRQLIFILSSVRLKE